MMSEELILTVTEHRIFGKVLSVHFISKSSGELHQVIGLVTKSNIAAFKLSAGQKEIVHIIDEYSERNIAKIFSKKKQPAKKFFDTLPIDFFQENIRPYIEKRIAKCIGLITVNRINLYYKNNPVHIYEEDKIILFNSPSQAIFNFERTDEGTNYYLSLRQGDKEINLLGEIADTLTIDPCNLILNKKLYSFTNIDAKKLLPFFSKKHITIKKEAEKKYYETFILNALKKYTVKATGFEVINNKESKHAILSLEKNWKNEPVLLLKFRYGKDKIFLANETSKVFIKLTYEKNHFSFYKTSRDEDWENNCILELKGFGLVRDVESNFKSPNMPEEPDHKQHFFINWLTNNKPALEEKGFILVQEHLDQKFFTQNIQLDIKLKEKNDWFDIYAMVHFGEYSFPFIRLKNYILNNIREFKLPSGEIAILPEGWFSDYKDLFIFGKESMGNFMLKKHHYQLVQNKPIGIDPSYQEGFVKLSGENIPAIGIPKSIKARLRPYQEKGYHWLYNLHSHSFGGCLADDMGLGKTLQTLCLLQQLIFEKKNIINNAPTEPKSQQLSIFDAIKELDKDFCKPRKQAAASLIVMPTSLVHNWYNEIKKFTPSFAVLNYTGMDRKKYTPASFYNYDIILTSYGTLRNDFEILSNYHYFYLILDESQYIKNPESKTYKAVTSLNASNRLVITGTPIENSLTDLWAQLNFLNEGMLGNLSFFKNEFVTPIEKYNDEAQQKKLQLLIQPFILRRTKSQVAKDLPPLTEQEVYCVMTEEQQLFYENEKSKIRNAILESIDGENAENVSFMILQGLMKLRQASNHPKLVDASYPYGSGKFEEISRNIESLLAEGHKVLLFSTFVEHLTIFAKLFEEQNWKYSMLTGESTKREQIISEFQEDESNRLFLISLKAGGVGLNLTSADYVFLLDPWWNPASESQAISRAHRIGQDKKVFVYRFITQNSIEEKIQILQEKKADLADVFINSNNPFKELDKGTLLELFE